ncbi:MAG: MarR family winged helix-turn-helix transcriptional regulator [Novosphingobium sp.]
MGEGDKAEYEHELRRDIGLKLTVITRMFRNQFDRMVAAHNITRSQWTMIVVVARQPGATQRSIAEALDMSEASAGRLIDRLCADGLLERRERHDDRRARAVYITQAAEPLLEKLAEVARSGEDRVFKGFSVEELETFKAYLDRLYRNVG